ncbi:hypothetical protein [Rhodococcus sp. ACPA1]|uniref:hypothetical protein n=1 Tax=Rhodococcus sp. ACPA1 TaxID=2028572 RepID=UPI000BB14D93|nr:hypothetical protein [Rhodococcus sp. ACPA1]PBC57036.1 hypothetical protein CJ177_15795 [Rhodococcus sp. ACPA1]
MDNNTGRLTLALDDLFANMSEILADMTPEQRTKLRDAVPAGFQDQIRAATTDTEAMLMAGIEATTGLRGKAHVPPSGVPDWLRLGALDELARLMAGTGRTCIHNPSFYRPQPIFAAAHKPGLVVCGRCLAMLIVRGENSKVCDGCGHTCTGPENKDGIHETVVMIGGLAYSAGMCRDCLRQCEAL